MKTKIPLILSCILSLFIILSFTSCPEESIRGVNNIDGMPLHLKTVVAVNSSSEEGTVIVTDTTITVALGSNPTDYGTYALELNTSLALAAGYTIEDGIANLSFTFDEELKSGDFYVLTYSQTGKPTLSYIFDILYPNDINIYKRVDETFDSNFITYFTWPEEDL